MSYTKRFFALLTLLILIGLQFTAPPAIFASATRFPLQQVDKDRIDAYIHSRMQIAGIPGLALGVIYGDQIVYLKGYGIAGPDARAVTPQTPFILGSTSKSFTALAVMQLVEAGKIDLDAPVTRYLSWFRTSNAAASDQITVRNLLNQIVGCRPTKAARASRITTRVVWRSKTAFETCPACSSVSPQVRATNTPTKITTFWG